MKNEAVTTLNGSRQGEVVACIECDLVMQLPQLESPKRVCCPRCGYLFAKINPFWWQTSLALSLAAAIMFILAHVTPLMALEAVGRFSQTTITGGVIKMWQEGEALAAILVGFCVIVAPALQIILLMTMLLGASGQNASRWVGRMLVWWQISRHWSMSEVMLLGILVALIKVSKDAAVFPNVGVFACGALVFLLAAMVATFDEQALWRKIIWVNPLPQNSEKSL